MDLTNRDRVVAALIRIDEIVRTEIEPHLKPRWRHELGRRRGRSAYAWLLYGVQRMLIELDPPHQRPGRYPSRWQRVTRLNRE